MASPGEEPVAAPVTGSNASGAAVPIAEPDPVVVDTVGAAVRRWAEDRSRRCAEVPFHLRFTEQLARDARRLGTATVEGAAAPMALLERLADAEDALAARTVVAAEQLGITGVVDAGWMIRTLDALAALSDTPTVWWATHDLEGLLHLAISLGDRFRTSALEEDRLVAELGPGLLDVDGDVVEDARAHLLALRRGAMPLSPDAATDRLHDLLTFAEETARTFAEVEPLIDELSAIFGADLHEVASTSFDRIFRQVRRMAGQPPPNPDWVEPDALAFARAAVESAAPAVLEAQRASRAVDDRYLDAIWDFAPESVTPYLLETLARTAAGDRGQDVAVVREALARRRDLIAYDAICGRSLGPMWNRHRTDVDAVLTALDAVAELQDVFGEKWNERQMRSLFAGAALSKDELRAPLRTIDQRLGAWLETARALGFADAAERCAGELLDWAGPAAAHAQKLVDLVGSVALRGTISIDQLGAALDTVVRLRAVASEAAAHADVLGLRAIGSETDWPELLDRMRAVSMARGAWQGRPAPPHAIERVRAGTVPATEPLETALHAARNAASAVDAEVQRLAQHPGGQ